MKCILIQDHSSGNVITVGEWLADHPVTECLIDAARKLEALDRLAKAIVGSKDAWIYSGWIATQMKTPAFKATWAIRILPFRKFNRLTVHAALSTGVPTREEIELLMRNIQVALSESQVDNIRTIDLFICDKPGKIERSRLIGTNRFMSRHGITRTVLRNHKRRPR